MKITIEQWNTMQHAISLCSDYELKGTFHCNFSKPSGVVLHYAKAATMPEAICIAALKAKGVL